MQKKDVIAALNKVRGVNKEWAEARLVHTKQITQVTRLLLLECTVWRMSAEEVSRELGIGPSAVRKMLREMNLDPKKGKQFLSKQAAEALAENAKRLGVEVGDMDLLSPLAYLPMGEKLSRELSLQRTQGVSGNEEPSDLEVAEIFQKAWNAADERGEQGNRTLAGIKAVRAYLSLA